MTTLTLNALQFRNHATLRVTNPVEGAISMDGMTMRQRFEASRGANLRLHSVGVTSDEKPPHSNGPTAVDDAIGLQGCMADVLQRAASGSGSAERSVSSRLQSKFGLGDTPSKRKELYRKLESLVATGGDRVLDLINECVADSVGRDKPGRYFCRAICARLREAGIREARKGGDSSW